MLLSVDVVKLAGRLPCPFSFCVKLVPSVRLSLSLACPHPCVHLRRSRDTHLASSVHCFLFSPVALDLFLVYVNLPMRLFLIARALSHVHFYIWIYFQCKFASKNVNASFSLFAIVKENKFILFRRPIIVSFIIINVISFRSFSSKYLSLSGFHALSEIFCRC